MKNQKITLDHVGWITNNPELFEKFWVDIIGFKKVYESKLSIELSQCLFNIPSEASCRKYQLGDMFIEIHVFDLPSERKELLFNRFGINHICWHLENRQAFLKEHNLKAKIYNNPNNYQNIFIQDFEGNWIELRETFKK